MKINFNKKYTIKYLMSELIWLRKESDYRVILDRLTSSDDEIIILTIGVLKSRGYYILSELLITFSNKKILADEELYNYRAFNHMLSNRESMLLFHVFLSECYKYNIIKGGIYSKDGYKNSIEKKIYNNYLEYIYNNSDIKNMKNELKDELNRFVEDPLMISNMKFLLSEEEEIYKLGIAFIESHYPLLYKIFKSVKYNYNSFPDLLHKFGIPDLVSIKIMKMIKDNNLIDSYTKIRSFLGDLYYLEENGYYLNNS